MRHSRHMGFNSIRGKTIDGELNGTCIGVDLVGGLVLAANAPKLIQFLQCVSLLGSYLLAEDDQSASRLRGSPSLGREGVLRMSPNALASILGIGSWFCQLNRPLFAVLDRIYAFTTSEPRDVPRTVPDAAILELVHLGILSFLFPADLTRPWAREVYASDASVSFGFGVSVATVPAAEVQRLSRLGAPRESYVRLERDGGDTDEAERPRSGTPYLLHLSKRRFRTLVSARRHYQAHSGGLEAAAVVLMLRWITRSKSRHSARLVALVDAQAVIGALTKGRTSAPSLRREVRRVAALTLSADLDVKYVYVPSEDNAADAPSRGIRRPRLKQPSCRACIKTRFKRAEARTAERCLAFIKTKIAAWEEWCRGDSGRLPPGHTPGSDLW